MSGALASREPTSLVAVHDQCEAIEVWAETCESVPELRDATNKLAAIDEYLNRTSTEGRARVAAAMRRLEARIGSLLGPRQQGRRDALRHHGDEVLNHRQEVEFRQMAEHPEVVEEVIAESTDEAPASRRKVMDRIRQAKTNHPVADDNKRSVANVRAREEKVREMAERGHTRQQIAAAVDCTEGAVVEIAKRIGVEIHADKVVGKTRRHDSNRIVDQTVIALEAAVMALDLVEMDALDADQIERWAVSLSNSLRSLNRFAKQMKETTR